MHIHISVICNSYFVLVVPAVVCTFEKIYLLLSPVDSTLVIQVLSNAYCLQMY